ncbi:MAG: hypothetical protein V2A62_03850 [Candidatus Woesearchaeota archaeon]
MTTDLETKISVSEPTPWKTVAKGLLLPGYSFKIAQKNGVLDEQFFTCITMEAAKIIVYGFVGTVLYNFVPKIGQ